MKGRLLVYLAAPILLVGLLLLQFAIGFARGPGPTLPLVVRASSSEARLFVQAARAGGIADLRADEAASLDPGPVSPLAAGVPLAAGGPGISPAGASAAGSSGTPPAAAPPALGLAVCDVAIRAPDPAPPGGGSPFQELEAFKNRAWGGASVVFGYHSLAESQPGAAMADLAETTGLVMSGWLGVSVKDLGDPGKVPATMRRSWEAGEGRPWAYRGDGIVLQNLGDGRVLVLRRGVELGRGGFRVRGAPSRSFDMDAYFSGWFVVAEAAPGTETRATFTFDALPPGAALLSAAAIPASFPALTMRAYGHGLVWSMLGDFAGPDTRAELLSALPIPWLAARMTLDSPENSIARFWRLLVPMVADMLSPATTAAAPAIPTPATTSPGAIAASRGASAPTTPATPAIPTAAAPAIPTTAAPPDATVIPLRLRSEGRYFERLGRDGAWNPWFVRGVDIGASVPGGTATEPPTDDAYWLGTFEKVAQAGFDSIRIYTLLPPAFYRALARFNLTAQRPLFLFQGIWLDEDPPGQDLLDPAWMAATLAESDRCEDALHGAASIPPRKGRSWGNYRVDVSPWLAAFLVGRELLPEEVEGTEKAHPDYRWEGRHFSVPAGQPVLSFLAGWADRVQTRELARYGQARPVGLVSWPTLDPLHHPGEWTAGSSKAPYQDRDVVDFRAVSVGPDEKAGFFTAFHVYPNYPDFMTRDRKYAIPDPSGMARYGAYLSDLISVLPPRPFLVAEFGLSTGFGTAHLHPEGLDHGDLTEAAQAAGLIDMFKTIAARGASGAMVFEWSDEWAKKTWTTEPFMIPYDRHQLWHNVIDPEQNYGILGWTSTRPLHWTDSGAGLRTAGDPDFFLIELSLSPVGDEARTIEIGLDTVGGERGQYRLSAGGPLGPQGSEFKLRIAMKAGLPTEARLLVSADYARGAGKLWPEPSNKGDFTTISTLVNAGIRTQDGIVFPPLYEDGSRFPLDSASGPGLITVEGPWKLLIRLPWSRLNIADPSSGTILLDRRDVRPISAEDAIGTTRIDSIGIWIVETEDTTKEQVFIPGRTISFRAPLAPWESVLVAPRPKQVLERLPGFLSTWDPLAAAAKPYP